MIFASYNAKSTGFQLSPSLGCIAPEFATRSVCVWQAGRVREGSGLSSSPPAQPRRRAGADEHPPQPGEGAVNRGTTAPAAATPRAGARPRP